MALWRVRLEMGKIKGQLGFKSELLGRVDRHSATATISPLESESA